MRYRIRYDHTSDGAGEVTRCSGQPLDRDAAIELARTMAASGDYQSVQVEEQARPGARWEATAPSS